MDPIPAPERPLEPQAQRARARARAAAADRALGRQAAHRGGCERAPRAAAAPMPRAGGDPMPAAGASAGASGTARRVRQALPGAQALRGSSGSSARSRQRRHGVRTRAGAVARVAAKRVDRRRRRDRRGQPHLQLSAELRRQRADAADHGVPRGRQSHGAAAQHHQGQRARVALRDGVSQEPGQRLEPQHRLAAHRRALRRPLAELLHRYQPRVCDRAQLGSPAHRAADVPRRAIASPRSRRSRRPSTASAGATLSRRWSFTGWTTASARTPTRMRTG